MGRLILWAVLAAAALFALQGGEFSSMDLWKQRQRKLKLQARTDSLATTVDSLRRLLKAVRNDPATQERIARERFGMVRGKKEILYRFAEPKEAADSISR